MMGQGNKGRAIELGAFMMVPQFKFLLDSVENARCVDTLSATAADFVEAVLTGQCSFFKVHLGMF